jgi:thiol:disulfide interchange protein DsbD
VIINCLSLFGWILIATAAAASNQARTPHVTLTMTSETVAYQPGEPLWVGLRFDLIPHWHVYWRNPGDSGEAPRVDWSLPQGWQAGDIRWPIPERIPVGHLVNYGYEDSVTLLVELIPSSADSDTADIGAAVDWLVCREECIPESAVLTMEVPRAATPDSAALSSAGGFETVRGRWPVPFDKTAAYRLDGDELLLDIAVDGWSAEQIANVWFAAHEWGPVSPSGEQRWTLRDGRLSLTIPAGEAPATSGSSIDGLLVVTERSGSANLSRGFTLSAEPAGSTVSIGLPLALLLAFAGGLILNLMPCVLPVLSIKVLGFARHAGAHSTRHGVAFAVGVLLTFVALAVTLLALRAGGSAVGWGFQLQEPLVIIGLMYLMLALALNLSGVFTLGGRLMGVGESVTRNSGLTGTFANGVLAVIIASPCTAPFMGAALGFAVTQSNSIAIGVFVALGAGFALPVLVLSIWPNWLRWLPPPGAWMERLRNALAFPMYAAAAWLLWVLSQQAGATVLGAALTGSVLLAFALWWLGQPSTNRLRHLLVVFGFATAGIGTAVLLTALADPQEGAIADAERWSEQRVRELQREGRAVLVNFTAAWCITCKVNEQVALSTDRVRDTLARRNIAYLKGDWTRRDAAITAALERHGRSGVPLYLLFPPVQGQPQILPQLLTEGLVLQAIENI